MRSSPAPPTRSSQRVGAKRARPASRRTSHLRQEEGDQLGDLPPGTVVTALTEHAPAWPAVVLGYSEALRICPQARVASRETLRRMRHQGGQAGIAVRYFGDNSVSLVAQGMAHVFVPGSVRSLSWQWEATQMDGMARRWPPSVYEPSVRSQWEAAIVEASIFCRRSCRVKLLWEGDHAEAVARLSPGTLVWGLTSKSPFWPGRICNDADAARAGLAHDEEARSSDHRPVAFIGPGSGVAVMSVADLSHFTPGPAWRSWMRARSERERLDRGWPIFSPSDWDEWSRACDDAERLFGQLCTKRPAPPAFAEAPSRSAKNTDRISGPPVPGLQTFGKCGRQSTIPINKSPYLLPAARSPSTGFSGHHRRQSASCAQFGGAAHDPSLRPQLTHLPIPTSPTALAENGRQLEDGARSSLSLTGMNRLCMGQNGAVHGRAADDASDCGDDDDDLDRDVDGGVIVEKIYEDEEDCDEQALYDSDP